MIDVIQPNLIFLFISGVFLLGFFGNLIFRRTKISDIIFLILIGFLLGSGLNIIPLAELNLLKDFSSFFGALALIILMFEGGLHLKFFKVLSSVGKAGIFTILGFILTVGLSSVLLYYVFSVPLIYGILIGAVVGGTSSAVVIPLISRSSAKEDTKVLLTLESAITDVLCVITVIAVVDIIISKTASVQLITQNIFSAFAIAAVIGAAGGIFWLRILRDFKLAREFGYLLTLSFLFLVYILIEFAKGNGAFGVLIFGIVLGNGSNILSMFRMKTFSISNTLTQFQAEISLFIKAFFFIYLGILIEISDVTFKIVIIALALIAFALVSRFLVIKLIFRKNKDSLQSKFVMSLHARGLAAAVLATYPLTMGLVDEYTLLILPIAFLVIIISNISTTVLFFKAEKAACKLKSSDDSSDENDENNSEDFENDDNSEDFENENNSENGSNNNSSKSGSSKEDIFSQLKKKYGD